MEKKCRETLCALSHQCVLDICALLAINHLISNRSASGIIVLLKTTKISNFVFQERQQDDLMAAISRG